MAAYQFDQPVLNWSAGDVYQEFQRFKQHVNFTFKGPLAKTDDKDRAGWLGMWIGQQGREVYKTFTWDEGEEDDPTKIMSKLEDYVRPRKNKRVARFKAHQRKQLEGETFDNFVKDLRLLMMDCEYSDTDDILIDLIINGVRHLKVQERLLDQGQNLTLTKAIEIGRQFEMSQSQLKMFRGEQVLSVKSVPRGSPKKKTVQPHKKPETPKHPPRKTETTSKCGNCGLSHEKGKCPAKGTLCKYCKKPDHWLKVCRKRLRVSAIQVDDDEHSDSDLLHIYTTQPVNEPQNSDKWLISLTVLDKPVNFRIDTGAKCCILVKSKFDTLKTNIQLQKSPRTLKSYTNHRITPVGSVSLPVKHKGRQLSVNFEIVDIQQENIISGDVAECLGLVKRIDKISESTTAHDELSRDFPDLVKTTGTLPGEYRIEIQENAKGVIHPPRRLPSAVKDRAIEELHTMESNGYITKVDEPTEWVSSMVVSLRKDKIRICIDPKDLNEVIKREHYPMKTIDDVVSGIPGAKVFSVLDAKSGFLQIKLDRDSSYLTTFNTPIGRFRWLRLPFGIKSAPEIYQRIMDQMLEGIEGAFAIIDDILVAGRDTEHHDQILRQVIERATQYNLKLNFDKCHIRQPSVSYMGHVITAQGLQPDSEKVKAIVEMPAPTDKEGLRRFLGLVQYLAKFIPNLSQVDAPLRSLLKSDVTFIWNFEQETSFQKLKNMCSTPPVLAYYDVKKPVQIECDSSKDGLGAVLMQEDRVIAYASRSLTDTEKRYAQIEKEMLSIVFSVTKFHCFIFGKETVVYNDHKPLEQIFAKPLLSAPMRIQKMMLKLQSYDLKVRYRKGKEMHVSDALSRAYLPYQQSDTDDIDDMIGMISVSKDKYSEIQELTKTELEVLYSVIVNGWPDTRDESPFEARPYWDSRDQLTFLDGIIYKGLRIVIPPSLREHMLKLIHKSHLGMVKCKQRAREVMYWPCMNSDIEQCVRDCVQCAEHQKQQASEPLKPTLTPDLPYCLVGCDLFDFESKKYILLVDYYSKYCDVVQLESETTSSVINAMKSVFACHGIPLRLRSDNGPQFSSVEFKRFCQLLGIEHETSSPHFQSANGEAERAIQTVKNLWRKADDKQMALLDYRTTPMEGISLSPAQLLMGRRPRNTLPASRQILKPSLDNTVTVKRHFDSQKERQKFYHDHRKGVKELPPLTTGSSVRMSPMQGSKVWSPGTVVKHSGKPNSYIVQSGDRLYRRNRKHLRVSTDVANRNQQEIPCEMDDTTVEESNLSGTAPAILPPTSPASRNTSSSHTDGGRVVTPGKPSAIHTRSGRQVKPPMRLDM